MQTSHEQKKSLAFILLLKALLVIGFIKWSLIGLGPDEAQYWTWSQEPDFGYYSKPPGIAWQIFGGTALLGHNELGVRLGSVILGLLIPLAVYLLASVISTRNTAFWAAIAIALTPLGLLSSFLAITDTGMAFFWTLALWAVIRRDRPDYLLAGLFIALAALFKWPAYAFWVVVAIAMVWLPKFRDKSIVAGIALSLLGLLPSFYWNVQNNFASFRHVLATLIGSHVSGGEAHVPFNPNFFEFLGAQVALVSPILFVMLVIALIAALKKTESENVRFVAISVVSIIGLCLALSLVKKMQGNWASFAYPAGIAVMATYASERWRNGLKWMQAGIGLSLVLSLLIFHIPVLQSAGVAIPHKASPFKHNVGWEELDDALLESDYNPKRDFLFADTYQTTSLLSFYGPGQKRAYFFNLQGSRKNQFSYWPTMSDNEVGRTGYFVVVNACSDECIAYYSQALQPYFETVEYLGAKPLFFIDDTPVKEAHIFRASNYNGDAPRDPELY